MVSDWRCLDGRDYNNTRPAIRRTALSAALSIYERLNLLFKSNRAAYCPVALDEKGMLPEALAASGADIACVTPSHQFPSGNAMPVSRRIQLLNFANEQLRRYLIEDDYDSEFRYSGRPIPSLQGLDTGEKVIYMGAFSKSLTPAMRVSYMVLPLRLLKTYREKLGFYLCPVPVIEQKVLHRFIREGYFERHLNRMRNLYKAKREALVKVIGQLLPDAQIAGAQAGLHLILKPNSAMTEAQLIAAAAKQGVKIYGYSQYFFDLPPANLEPSLLLGFATLTTDGIIEAVGLMKKAWSQ